MATEDEAREAADDTGVQVEAVDLGTVHLKTHPEGKLPSIMEIKNMGEIIDSTEGTLKIPEDQVLVEAPSEFQLPPEDNLNGEASSLNGYTEKEEKISNEKPHENDQEEAELDQSNRIKKEEVTDGLSHAESRPEDSCLLKHKKDEEPKGDDQQDLGVTVDDNLVQEDTNTTDNAIEQTDYGQQDQKQEPEKANKNTKPASITNNADVEVIAEASAGLQAPVEPHMNDSDAIPETTCEKTEAEEPANAECVVHPETVAKAEDQQSQQADITDADVVQEVIKCEEADVQVQEPKSEAHEPTVDAQGVLNQESAEETDDSTNGKIEETAHQSNMAVPKEITPEHEATTTAPGVNTEVKNQESLEEIEDPEAEIQQSSGFEDAIPEDQPNLDVTMDNDTVQEDTLQDLEQKDNDHPEKAKEDTQPASMTNISHDEVVPEAPSEVQTPGEPNLENADSVPDCIHGNTETDEPDKAHADVHPEQKESFPEDTSTAEPTEEVVKVEDQQIQQADAMDAELVQEEVPKSEQADEPATDALEGLNQEFQEETEGPVDEKTEAEEPANAECVVYPEAVAKVEDQKSQQADTIDADVVQEVIKCEEADVHGEDPKSEAHEPTVDAQGVLNQASAEETDDLTDGKIEETAHQSNMAVLKEITPEHEATTTAPPVNSEVQTPGEPNLDNADSVPDCIHGNTETYEPDKAHAVVHPEQKESFPEDTSTEEPTEEVVKVEDQQVQQADAMDAEMVQEEVPKSEHADESAPDALEGLNQECAEETDVPVNEKTEEIEHKSNMVVPEETMPEHDAQMSEPPVNIQEQSQESLGDAEAVDTEAETRQSSVAFEETTPEDHVTSTETCSEIQHVSHVEPEEINGPGDAKYEEITNMSNTENPVQDNILQSGPTTDTQPVQELEQIDSKSTGTREMNEASDQTHAIVFNDLAQEEVTATSEPQVPETEEELKDIEATEAQEISKHDHVTPSKELAVENDSTADEPHNGEIHQTLEQNLVKVKDHDKTISNLEEDTVDDNITAEEPICGSQEVNNAESTEETKQNVAENTAEVSDVAIVDEVIEQNVLRTVDIAETNRQELEPEETKSTEPVESEEASDQRNAALFDDSAQEENTQESEMQQMESATEIKEIEPTEVEAVPQESNAWISEEPSPEDYIKESETICENQEVNITESAEVIDSHKDIITGGISGQSNMVSAGDLAEESNALEGEQPAYIKAVEELGSEEIKNTEIEEVNETSHEMNATIFQTPTQEDNPATTELHETTEVRNIEATEEQRNTHQSDDAAQSEAQAAEEMASGPEILEQESVEDNDTEANEPQSTPQQNISTSEEYVLEEILTEDSISTKPEVDNQQRHDQDSDEFKEIEADRSQEIALSSTLSSVESTSEDNAAATEPISDTHEDNSQVAEETEDTENVKSTTAPAEAAAPETEANADTSSVHEEEREETKDTEPIETEDVNTSSDLPSETMDIKTVPHESHVGTINELTEDDISTPNAPHADTEPVPEVASVEDTKCTDTTEHPGETHGCTSNEPVPTEENTPETEPDFNTQELQSLTSQEIKDTEDDKTDELLDISTFPTPGEEDQASNLPRTEPTPDDQEVQELGLTEETREIEARETKDHQEHIVSTLEEPAVDSELNADDQQVHEDKLPEVKDNKAIEAEEASKQSNTDTLDSAAEVRNELESDLDSYVQPAQHAELSKDNENSQLVKAEETSGQSNSIALEERTTEDCVASEIDPPLDIKQEQEQEPVEEIKGVDATEAEGDFDTSQVDPIEKLASNNNTETIELTYDVLQVDDLEASKEKNAEAINDGLSHDAAQSEGKATEEIASGPEILEPESVQDNETKANKSQSTHQQNISTSEEYVSEEMPTEDSVTTKPEVDIQQRQDQESDEIKEIEDDRSQEIALSSTLSSVESTSEDNAAATEPSSDTHEDNSQVAEETEDAENVKSNTAPAEAAPPETEANADTSSVHEAEREETKDTEPIETDDVMTSSDLPSENMDMEPMETGAVPHESQVASIQELTEDDLSTPNAPHVDTEPVPEVESVEDTKCTDTTEHPGEPHGSTSNEPIPTEENTPETEPDFNTQEVQNLTSQEIKDTEDDKTDELLDISSFPTPGEEDQSSNLPRIEPTPDDQEVQELGLTEETREIEAVETNDHQEYIVSTLEKPAVDSEPNADDQHVHEDKVPEAKDNKAIETEEASKQSNTDTLDSAAEVRNELESDLDSYVQPAQQAELSKDNENSQLVKAEETSGQSNSVALDERTTEDCVASEIDPPLDIKQEQEQEPVEEIKGVDDTETEGDFDTSQVDAIEKLASNYTETIEPTYDVLQVDDLEATKETKNAEAINDGEQSNIAASEESTPTDNGATPEERPVESNEGIVGNETENVILAHGSNDEIQKSVEPKKEDEEIESQNDELQVDEQKHENNGDDLTIEPLVECQNIQNEATNRTEDNDGFEAEQTEAAITEIVKNEQALHISKESTPSIMDVKVENVKETSEGTEEDDDAKNDNKYEQENAQNDDIVAKNSTHEQGETTDEIRNEEDPVAITQNVESEEHREDKASTNKANDAVHAIQSSEKETVDEIEESKENKDYAIFHDELQTNSGKEKAPQLCSNEPNNVTKVDDKTPLGEDIIHDNASIKPREIEEIGENKGLDSTSEPLVESSIQHNPEDLNSHHKVEDEKLSMSEQNVDTEAVQETINESASYINQTKQCQEVINADGLLQLETEENSFDKIEETDSHEETETSNTTAAEAGTINDDITDKDGEADGAPSDVCHKAITDTGRDRDVSSVITTPKEESMKENMEDHNLDLPEHLAQNDNTPEQALCLEETEIEMPLSEELLQPEPGENQIPNEQDGKDIQAENQIPKEKNEEDMQYTEIGEAKKGDEPELPVSHFLMNLILGKENSDANGDSRSEAERKQGEVTEDGSCASISKQEENLGSVPTENMVQDNITFEEEKHELKCPEQTEEMVKQQSDDRKLDTERSAETDEDFKRNSHGLEIPAYQDNPQDEISGELLSEESSGIPTKMEARDIDIPSVEQDDRVVDTVCQENTEVSTENENGSLRSSLNDSTKASEEDTQGEGQTGLVLEPLPEDKSVDAVSEQAPLLIESRVIDANDLSSDTESVQNPLCAKQDKPTESSTVEATSSPDIQLENEEVAKKEEEQHANITTDEVSQPNVESSDHNLQKSTSSEVTSNELATQITEPVRDTQTILAHEKEISEENFQTAVQIQADGQNMQINQDQQDEIADKKSAMEPEKSGEANSQEHQESADQRSPKEADEGGQLFLVTKEQDVHETVESPMQTVSVKSNEDQKLHDTKVQERDLNVVSPREASESEENFVDVTKPEFSTDEEQSPKADAEEKIYGEKIKGIEGIKNFTDESAMKTEAPGAAQKARKKNSLLSGVGSKVKHQLAKVKKAIVGKPGRTKPESPKA